MRRRVSADRRGHRARADRATWDPPPVAGPASRRPPSAARPDLFRVLLPLRVFAGATFLYAGLDKLLDLGFLRASGPGSIGEQLAGFTHSSPLAPLVQALALPAPVLVGFVIAVAEIAIGLGALSGVLYRLSAAGGVALSVLFWLTASWTVHPYYYGPDLPYALGWLTLALAGHGGLYVLEPRLDRLFEPGERDGVPSPERRLVLRLGILAGASIGLAAVTGVIGSWRGSASAGSSAVGSTLEPAAMTTPAPAAPTVAPAGDVIGRLDQIATRAAVDFVDPGTGDPAVLVRLGDGNVVAFDAVCTHQGCTVGYDPASGLLLCPCHGAAFDPGDRGAVLAGPTRIPLAELAISVDAKSGTITLKG